MWQIVIHCVVCWCRAWWVRRKYDKSNGTWAHALWVLQIQWMEGHPMDHLPLIQETEQHHLVRFESFCISLPLFLWVHLIVHPLDVLIIVNYCFMQTSTWRSPSSAKSNKDLDPTAESIKNSSKSSNVCIATSIDSIVHLHSDRISEYPSNGWNHWIRHVLWINTDFQTAAQANDTSVIKDVKNRIRALFRDHPDLLDVCCTISDSLGPQRHNGPLSADSLWACFLSLFPFYVCSLCRCSARKTF